MKMPQESITSYNHAQPDNIEIMKEWGGFSQNRSKSWENEGDEVCCLLFPFERTAPASCIESPCPG